ncbi:MAG: hypothetical protein U9R15_18480 [Chloroflexota bacterium]|nr:hypothetical protein [Chloroflexota bacterium]
MAQKTDKTKPTNGKPSAKKPVIKMPPAKKPIRKPLVKKPVKKEPLFTVEKWSGIKEVYKCTKCSKFMDDKDDMIEHVLTHIPQDKQSEVLEQMLKE